MTALCIHDLFPEQCAFCNGMTGPEGTGASKHMAYYDEPDEHGNPRQYQTWWGGLPTKYGPADIELVSAAPPRRPEGGQPAWTKSSPVDYRVRFTGEGPGDWRPLHFEKPEPSFRKAIEQALMGERPESKPDCAG